MPSAFCCPRCKSDLEFIPSRYTCESCNSQYDIRDGIPDFYCPGPDKPEDMNLVYLDPAVADAKDRVFDETARNYKGMSFCIQEIANQTEAGSRILEVGIGSGHFTQWISESVDPNTEIYAFDFSWPMLEKAAKNTGGCPNVHLFRANGRAAMPFGLETFDIILVRLTPFKPQDQPDACFHLLKPGGWYFNASTIAGERFDIPPTQYAADIGFESADYHIWRYPSNLSDDALLAVLIDGLRKPYETVDIEKTKALVAHRKRESGTPEGIENTSVEALLVARKSL